MNCFSTIRRHSIGDVDRNPFECHLHNVDGACDASDSDDNDNDEQNDRGGPNGRNVERPTATGNGNSSFEGVYIKEEMEGNEEEWTDPMDHVEVILPFKRPGQCPYFIEYSVHLNFPPILDRKLILFYYNTQV